MQQNIADKAITKPRFDTEGHVPSWYRPSLAPSPRVGHLPAKRMFIGSGEDCMVDELNVLTEEEECTS